MLGPALLTLVAVGGVALGILLGWPQRLSTHLSAAGGGLLLGLAGFWLLPEVANDVGWTRGVLFSLAIFLLLAALDRALLHDGFALDQNVVGPLLAVTAIHSFLDGWSVRAAAIGPLATVAVPLGLALHKLPEGLALGWVSQKRFRTPFRSFAAATCAELFTLLGGVVEPRSELAGVQRFGAAWIATILAAITGTFFFLGCHALWPARREKAAVAIFAATLLTVALAAHLS